MSWFDRRTVLLALAVLAGCGFAPAYGPGGAAGALFGRVEIAPPTDRDGFDLAQRLEERLGHGQAPDYDLTYRIETDETGLGITPENSITRYHVLGKVSYSLTDAAGAVVSAGTVESFTAYSASGSTVAALAAQEDASLRLMRILADQIFNRIVADTAKKP